VMWATSQIPFCKERINAWKFAQTWDRDAAELEMKLD